jgi:hypothetical protein
MNAKADLIGVGVRRKLFEDWDVKFCNKASSLTCFSFVPLPTMSSHHPSTAAAPSSPIQILPQWILAIVSYLFSDKKKRHLIVSIFLTALVISVSFGTTSTLVLQGVDNNISFTGTTSHSVNPISSSRRC